MTSFLPLGSPALGLAFIVLAVVMALAVGGALGSWRGMLAAMVWLALTGGLASSGVLARFSAVPPPMLLLLVSSLGLTLWLGLSSAGRALARLPLAVLIGAQAFRIAVELRIHWAVDEGIAPVQMTWTGLNFDILTGLTALVVAPLAARLPRPVLLVWNTLGLGLLLWVVGVAVLSMPTPLQRLHPSNTWVAFFPFVWLPAVLVPCALVGHVALFRKLAGPSRS